jgi:hypothetical protein
MNPEASEYIQMKKKFSNVITKDYFHNWDYNSHNKFFFNLE